MAHYSAKLVALFVCATTPAIAQFLAEDTVAAPVFNDSLLYFAGPGGYHTALPQAVLYEDVTSGVDTGMVWLQGRIEPCGIELPMTHNGFTELSYIVRGTIVGGLANAETGVAGHRTFGPGSVIPVPRNAMHSAENPSCTEPIDLLQAHSGGDRFQHTDILTSLVGMSPSSVQYGLELPNGEVDHAAETMRPVFAWNTECLARCGRSAPAPGVAGPTPSALAG